METRRDFLKKAAFIAAGGGLSAGFPASIQKALAIDPQPGTTFLDAEHVVILMQENRSFDHCYGSLRGVRGFNDPRAVTLPNGLPVWLQTNKAGETYAPFRLNIKETSATWIGSLPHSWTDQTDARNGGRHDGWLDAKRSGHKECAHLPITMGFYDREDIPFYYALADAFTVCDQNFCSSLTGTTPNRLYLWTGTIRDGPSDRSKANVRNEDVDYDSEVNWTTFPERLEKHGVSWKIYQNEISLDTGLSKEEEAWLANFTDNPIEWFRQFHVRFSASRRRHLEQREKQLSDELARLEAVAQTDGLKQEILKARTELAEIHRERSIYTEASFAKLPPEEQSLHRKAFAINLGDASFRELAELTYQEGAEERRMRVPKGDVLHQFREDVQGGSLPLVSWIVAPENFSDHPGAPWYGAWYLSEVLDILTQKPEVWRKTIFILCYDENDGYFDHVPPFVPPDPNRPETGKASAGIDTSVEQVRAGQEQEQERRHPDESGRTGPIGLGFRVPLVIASPWSRGGFVNSQVFDHTSVIQLLEKITSHRTGRQIRETNITAWRRAVCGDLTSVFQSYQGERIILPTPVEWKAFARSIHQARLKRIPNGSRQVSAEELAQARGKTTSLPWMPQQENGVRPSCALPYELAADGTLSADGKSFTIRFAADRRLFGERAAGAPFHVYTPGKYRDTGREEFTGGRTWSYAVAAGDRFTDSWLLADFADGNYDLRVHGPNGFYREFRGSTRDPALEVILEPAFVRTVPTGEGVLRLKNGNPKDVILVEVEDLAYGGGLQTLAVKPGSATDPVTFLPLPLGRSHGWYDFGLRIASAPQFGRRYSGRVESGQISFSDPFMGRV